jgi:hypothetical protein
VAKVFLEGLGDRSELTLLGDFGQWLSRQISVAHFEISGFCNCFGSNFSKKLNNYKLLLF